MRNIKQWLMALRQTPTLRATPRGAAQNSSFMSALLLSMALMLFGAQTFAGTDVKASQAITSLVSKSNGTIIVNTNRSHGVARFVSMAPGASGSLINKPYSNAKPKDTADAFLKQNSTIFGINNPETELKFSKEKHETLGSQVYYQQTYQGLPVYGAELVANVNASGDLKVINGRFIPNVTVDPTPTITEEQAKTIAQQNSTEMQREAIVDEGGTPSAIDVGAIKLMVFNSSIHEDRLGDNHLAWQVTVTANNESQLIFVDAHDGSVLGDVDLTIKNLSRRVYDAQQLNIGSGSIAVNYPNSPYWVEGNLFPTLDPFALPAGWKGTNDALEATKYTYNLYHETFGIDAPDNLGTKMDAALNYINGNAFASIGLIPRLYTGYGLDTATDDVVAHEWQHFYTHFASPTGLNYLNQGGALHEAYSDIMGEVVDFINIGTPFGGTDTPNSLRHDGMCSSFTANSPEARTAKLVINSPVSISDEILQIGLPSFGPLLTSQGITADAVYVNDGLGNVNDGCTVPFQNSVAGKIALIKRGNCRFIVKTFNAESQGALGVVIINTADSVSGMGGSSPPTVTIPTIMIASSTGSIITTALQNQSVNLTMKAEQIPRYTDNSIRWLLAEDTAGGTNPSIRDLWDPTCLGLPGKVSDSQYYCGTGDSGGAHTNMGVVSHAFALLVDGGKYNGQSIKGMGLTKATHIYVRAQRAYQTATMNFADHADALVQGCYDLVGQPLNALLSNKPSGLVIKPDECLNVAKAMDAVEMRVPPNCPINLKINNARVLEGQDGITNMVFTVTASALSLTPMSVDYEAVGITAESGSDFLPAKGTLIIPANTQTATIIVPIKGDTKPEGDEVLEVQLSNPKNTHIVDGVGKGIILNDD